MYKSGKIVENERQFAGHSPALATTHTITFFRQTMSMDMTYALSCMTFESISCNLTCDAKISRRSNGHGFFFKK